MDDKPKNFDAVEASRKWREESSLKLDAMNREERLAHLKAVGERYRAELRERKCAAASAN